MDEIIQIKCPFCGAVLSVKNQPGIETKNVSCPICKQKSPFTQFKRVTPGGAAGDDSLTEYPQHEEHTQYIAKEQTEIKSQNLIIGQLRINDSGVKFQLKPGRNVVGRKASKSEADFQIETGENRNMSREHIAIEVKKVPGKGFMHFLMLCKERINKTFIGNDPLLYGDRIVLNHGDIIRLPDCTLKFEIPDEEATTF